MPRAILDGNVLVSALITPAGAPARLLAEFRSGAFELVVSPQLLNELRDVLGREKIRRYVSPSEADAYVDLSCRDSIVCEDPEPSGELIGLDPDDQYLIDLARSAQVDVIVSGDARLLDMSRVWPLVTPAAFLASLATS